MRLLIGNRAGPDTPGQLTAERVSKRFGGLQAVQDVSFELPPGSVLGVIGPNGSGKTTLVNLLTGAYRPDSGSVLVAGVQAAGLPAHRIAELGVARTFQNPHVFRTLTVKQNMLISVLHRGDRDETRRVRAQTEEWLDKLGLLAHGDRVACELSGGQQKLVEFARAMVRRPRVVLMDEPFAGVHAEVKKVLHSRITEVARSGEASFLIVSHEIPDLVSLSDRFLCMAGGRVLVTGTAGTVCRDPRVVEAYLGASLEGAA